MNKAHAITCVAIFSLGLGALPVVGVVLVSVNTTVTLASIENTADIKFSPLSINYYDAKVTITPLGTDEQIDGRLKKSDDGKELELLVDNGEGLELYEPRPYSLSR